MRIYDIINKKKLGEELSTEEISFFINGFTNEEIPDYQVSALMMAICFQGMTHKETVDMTRAMMNSGDVLDLTAINGIKVDKHSTGGVGDTTTLVLGPMVAACGIPVAKMSGRGLGHTGGTIDKLESFDGFEAAMNTNKFINNVNEIGIAVAGQTGHLAPADKKLYALRDVTATVDNIALIASSVMSKKLAAGSDAIVLDVKTGSGAFMKDLDSSLKLAEEMVRIGTSMGKDVCAIISNMNQPLGRAIGNSLEVKEAISTLMGDGPEDLYQLCLTLGTQMLLFSKKVSTPENARNMLEKAIPNGDALRKFKEFIIKQGGNGDHVENIQLLPTSKYQIEVKSINTGYVSKIQAEEIGVSALILGAGRETKESKIDLGVGIYLNKKVGDYVKKGEVIAIIHSNNKEKASQVVNNIVNAYTIKSEVVTKPKLILGIVTKEGSKKF